MPSAPARVARASWNVCADEAPLEAVLADGFCDCFVLNGAPINVPIKSAKPKWGQQAVLVAVKSAPFATHTLVIERVASSRYVATATKVEDRKLSCPSGLGSFDACIFDLAEGEDAATLEMVLHGLPDSDATPLVDEPVFEKRNAVPSQC